MTFSKVEKLVTQISEALDQPALANQLPRLAEEYNECCKWANQRLSQCVAMLQAGDDLQALQLAEAAPPLLDIIAVVSFKDVTRWREICYEKQLPVPEAFDSRGIKLLNAAYARTGPMPAQLYAKYRQAVMRSQPEEALSVLQLIIRLCPDDQNARAEKNRVENQIASKRLEALKKALEQNAFGKVDSLLEELEQANISHANNEVIQQARECRFQYLLSEAEAAADKNDFKALQNLIKKAKPLMPSGAETDPRLARLEELLQTYSKAVQQQEGFDLAILDLRREMEPVIASGDFNRLSLSVCRNKLSGLERKWRDIERYNKPIPEQVTQNCRKAAQLLRNRIAFQQRSRRRWMVIGACSVVLLLGGLTKYAHDQHKVKAQETHLKQLASERKVAAAEEAISSAVIPFFSRKKATTSIETAKSFVAYELGLRDKLHHSLNALQEMAESNFAGFSVPLVQEALQKGRTELAECAAEFKGPAEIKLANVTKLWEKKLAPLVQQRDEQFAAQLASLEEAAHKSLDYERGPAELKSAIKSLEIEINKLGGWEKSALPMPPRNDLLQRFTTVKSKCLAFKGEVDKWDEFQNRVSSAATLADYLGALALVEKCALASSTEAKAAATILSQNLSDERILDGLLYKNNPNIRAAAESTSNFYPTNIVQGELSRIIAFRDDPNIQNVYAYKIVTRGENIEDHQKILYSIDTLKTNRTRSQLAGRLEGMAYNPAISGPVRFIRQDFSPATWTLQIIGQIPESQAFEKFGLLELSPNGKYTMSLLQVLDKINGDTNTHPLFRAFATFKIFEVIDLRPVEWGMPLALAALRDRERLKILGAGEINSGDWLRNPETWSDKSRELETHFTEARKISYWRQALFLRSLLQNCKASGFTFCGYVGPGNKIFIKKETTNKIWGLKKDETKLSLLFTGGVNNDGKIPQLWTPLISFNSNEEDLLRQTAHSLFLTPQDPLLKPENLPPLFSRAP